MLDLQLIPTLPTLKDLLGPDWETHTLRDAREAVAFTSMRQRWPRDLDRQVVESLRAFGLYAPRNYHAVNETLGELGQWREVLRAGVKIGGAGPLRRQILNRFFEVADAPASLESEDLHLETELPTLAELLGPEWEACAWGDATEVMRAWCRINPSQHGITAIRALTSTARRSATRTLGSAREELLEAINTWGQPTVRQIGPKSRQVLYHLFEIIDAPGEHEPTEARLKTPAERLLQLYERLPAAYQNAWIRLGQRMLADTEDAPTELTDIHPRLNRDQITLWLDLGEQMLQRAAGEEA